MHFSILFYLLDGYFKRDLLHSVQIIAPLKIIDNSCRTTESISNAINLLPPAKSCPALFPLGSGRITPISTTNGTPYTWTYELICTKIFQTKIFFTSRSTQGHTIYVNYETLQITIGIFVISCHVTRVILKQNLMLQGTYQLAGKVFCCIF